MAGGMQHREVGPVAHRPSIPPPTDTITRRDDRPGAAGGSCRQLRAQSRETFLDQAVDRSVGPAHFRATSSTEMPSPTRSSTARRVSAGSPAIAAAKTCVSWAAATPTAPGAKPLTSCLGPRPHCHLADAQKYDAATIIV